MNLLKLIVNTTSNNPFTAVLLQLNCIYDSKKAENMYINTGNLQISKNSWLKMKKDKPVMIQMKNIFNVLEACSTCKALKKGVNVNTIQELNLQYLVCENKMLDEKKRIFDKCYHF